MYPTSTCNYKHVLYLCDPFLLTAIILLLKAAQEIVWDNMQKMV